MFKITNKPISEGYLYLYIYIIHSIYRMAINSIHTYIYIYVYTTHTRRYHRVKCKPFRHWKVCIVWKQGTPIDLLVAKILFPYFLRNWCLVHNSPTISISMIPINPNFFGQTQVFSQMSNPWFSDAKPGCAWSCRWSCREPPGFQGVSLGWRTGSEPLEGVAYHWSSETNDTLYLDT